jgi:hypothetical protein
VPKRRRDGMDVGRKSSDYEPPASGAQGHYEGDALHPNPESNKVGHETGPFILGLWSISGGEISRVMEKSQLLGENER